MKRAKSIKRITEITLICLVLLGFVSAFVPSDVNLFTGNTRQTSLGLLMPENAKYAESSFFVVIKGITYALNSGFSGRYQYRNGKKSHVSNMDKQTGQGRIIPDSKNKSLSQQFDHLVKIHRWYIYLTESSGSEELPA
jgi:hypothetical protein